MNTIVIGMTFHPGQWDCPKDKAKKEVGVVFLDNNHTRKVVNSFDLVVALCIVNENENINGKKHQSLLQSKDDASQKNQQLVSWKHSRAISICSFLYG